MEVCGGDGGGSVVIVVSPAVTGERTCTEAETEPSACVILRCAVAHRSGSMTDQFLRKGVLAKYNKLTTLHCTRGHHALIVNLMLIPQYLSGALRQTFPFPLCSNHTHLF